MKIFAAPPFWGEIIPPEPISHFGGGTEGGGLIVFLNIILRLVFIVAGIYALWQIIVAGWIFMSSGGDPKALASARDKIIWSLFGLIILVSSFVLAAIIGFLVFGDPMAILRPKLIGPD